MLNFQHGLPAIAAESDLWPWPWLIAHPANFLLGWPFSVALLGILMTHEFGHYFACRAHGIRATLPWVLPAPTLSGTAGAVIQIRSRIPNRGALMDVGIYGPLPGFVASLIAVAVGFWLSPAAVASGAPDLIGFGHPLALRLVHAAVALVHPGTPAFDAALRHPILIAGWIGLFITSLNLIPGGQLDGGHILYAISPRLHRWSTRALPVVLILLGIFSWLGWIVWGLMLLIPAMRHPKVGARPALNRTRLLLGAAALVISILTFSMHPFASTSIWSYLRSL
jgi:membrane-associated protease RseP (regulator of RpoE activity)